jgi:hypothetical protein
MMNLNALLKSRDRFIGYMTIGWTVIAIIALAGRRLIAGNFGSPEYVGIALLMPIVGFFWAVLMWDLVLGRKKK